MNPETPATFGAEFLTDAEPRQYGCVCADISGTEYLHGDENYFPIRMKIY